MSSKKKNVNEEVKNPNEPVHEEVKRQEAPQQVPIKRQIIIETDGASTRVIKAEVLSPIEFKGILTAIIDYLSK